MAKNCKICLIDISNGSYRGAYCVPCDNKRRKENKENPKSKLIKTEAHKTCSKCNTLKSNDEFRSKGIICVTCDNLRRRKHYNENIEQSRKYAIEYRQNNLEICTKRTKEHKKTDKYKKSQLEYIRKRRIADPSFKIRLNLTVAIGNKLKQNKKQYSTIKVLGCSLDFFKKWLESNFDDNMSYNNYGSYWDLDHIKPCKSYNFNNQNDVLECFNWKNYRPCEHIENIKKSATIDLELINYYKNKAIMFEKTLN